MAHQHLDDLLADRVARIERGHRLLEDHRDAVAAQVAQRRGPADRAARCRRTSPRRTLRRSPSAAGPSRRATSRSCRSRTRRPGRASLPRATERSTPSTATRAAPAVAVEHDAQILDRQQRRGASFRLGASAAAMPASISARSITPTGLRSARQELREMHPALAAHRFEPLKLGERIGVIVDAQVEVGPLLLAVDQRAPPTACRACRRPRLRPPSARRSAGAETAARRSPRRPSRSPRSPRGPASMLPATEKPSPDV